MGWQQLPRHGIIESFRLEKTYKTIKPNLGLNSTLPTQPHHKGPHLLIFQILPGMVVPPFLTLGTLFPCLTALLLKSFFLISSLNLSWRQKSATTQTMAGESYQTQTSTSPPKPQQHRAGETIRASTPWLPPGALTDPFLHLCGSQEDGKFHLKQEGNQTTPTHKAQALWQRGEVSASLIFCQVNTS